MVRTFGSIRLGVSTVFLKNEITPATGARRDLLGHLDLALPVAWRRHSRTSLSGPWNASAAVWITSPPETAETVSEEEAGRDEYGLVTLKIAHLGRQMRDAKEIFSALKDNVDQIMGNLQDGLMLFTRDSRVVLVSASVERFLGRPGENCWAAR